MDDLVDASAAPRSSDDSIAAHIRALATRDELPLRAARACVNRLEEAGPSLRAAVDKAIVGGELSDDEDTLFVRSLFILAAARDAASCPLFYRLVRRPSHIVDDMLGDLVTEELPRLLASVFDGDAATLFELIGDRNVDEYVRGAALGAATFLTFEGRIPRDEMQAILRQMYETRRSEPSAFLWMPWVEAVGLLDLRDLVPLAGQAFSDGTIDPKLTDRAVLERNLDAAERGDPNRFADRCLGYVGDLSEQVVWCRHARLRPDDDFAPGETITNPHRNVGRNDPCPCGSGKKFKKCCLAA